MPNLKRIVHKKTALTEITAPRVPFNIIPADRNTITKARSLLNTLLLSNKVRISQIVTPVAKL